MTPSDNHIIFKQLKWTRKIHVTDKLTYKCLSKKNLHPVSFQIYTRL